MVSGKLWREPIGLCAILCHLQCWHPFLPATAVSPYPVGLVLINFPSTTQHHIWSSHTEKGKLAKSCMQCHCWCLWQAMATAENSIFAKYLLGATCAWCIVFCFFVSKDALKKAYIPICATRTLFIDIWHLFETYAMVCTCMTVAISMYIYIYIFVYMNLQITCNGHTCYVYAWMCIWFYMSILYIYIKAYTFCRSAGSTLVKGHPYTYVRLHPEEAATPRCGQGCNYHWFSQESIVIDLRNGQGGIWHGVASLAPNRQIYLYLMQGCCTKSHTTAMPYMLAAVF